MAASPSYELSPIVASSPSGPFFSTTHSRHVTEVAGEFDDDEVIPGAAPPVEHKYFRVLRSQPQQQYYGSSTQTQSSHFDLLDAVEPAHRTASVSSATPSPATTGGGFGAIENGGVLATVQALLTSVDAQSSRMQKTYVDSESKRASLQEELMATKAQLVDVMERCQAAERASHLLTSELATAHETISQLRDQTVDLDRQRVSLKERHDSSLELLRTFNNDFDAQRLEWKQAVEVSEGEVRRLRALTLEMGTKVATSDEHKAKVWSLERQLRSQESEMHEHVARVKVLECKLNLQSVDLKAQKDENDKLSTRVIAAERQARLSEHSLMAEQFRTKQLEALCTAYRSENGKEEAASTGSTPDALLPGSAASAQRTAAVEGKDMILLERIEDLSTQVVTLQGQLNAAHSAAAAAAASSANATRTGPPPHNDNDIVSVASNDSGRSVASPAAAIVHQHRALELDLHRLTLEKRLAQAEEGHQNAKGASLALSAQVETLSARLSTALQNQHAAEEVANGCRKDMTAALAREIEAVYTRTVTEEQMRYHDGAVESLLFSLAHAESLSLNATAEVDRFRKEAHRTSVDCERVTQQLALVTAANEQQGYQLTVAQRDKRDAQRVSVESLERAQRIELELGAVAAFLSCCQDELMSVQLAFQVEQQFSILSRQNLDKTSARLQTLVGDQHQEASMDDILKYLQGSAAMLKEVASACDDVSRNPPVFYGSLALSVVATSKPSHTVVMPQENNMRNVDLKYGQTPRAAAPLATAGVPTFTAARGSGSPSMREVMLAEAVFRNHWIAEEIAAWHHLAMTSLAFLGRCADHKDHLMSMNTQLQAASEHAANLFRAVKVFSLRQVRKKRVGAQYRELEQLNQRIWSRTQDIHGILWDVMNDPHTTLATKRDIRDKLETSTSLAASIPQTSTLTSSTWEVGSGHGGGSVGEMVAQLKLENDRLLEESERIAKQAASAESRSSELQRKLAEVERKAQNQAWMEASPFWRSGRTPQDHTLDGAAVEQPLALLAVHDDHHKATSLSVLYELIGSLTSAAHRSDALLNVYAGFCRKAITFAESRVVALHYTGTRNVFDVCVASAFLATTLQHQYRFVVGSNAVNNVVDGGMNDSISAAPSAHHSGGGGPALQQQDSSSGPPLPLTLGRSTSTASSTTTSGTHFAPSLVSPRLTPTLSVIKSGGEVFEGQLFPNRSTAGVGGTGVHSTSPMDLLRAALRTSQEAEVLLDAPNRPDMVSEYCQTEDTLHYHEHQHDHTSGSARSPPSVSPSTDNGNRSPTSPTARSDGQRKLFRSQSSLEGPTASNDVPVARLLHNEETTRILLREQHAALLVSLLHRAHEQVLWYTQLELQRITAELSQSHSMHDGATQVDHKQQLMSYARAIDECNERLVSFMKAKDSSDQECTRLRGELRRANDDSAAAKRHALQSEETSGDLRLQLSDSEERVRLLVRDRDQLAQRLRGFAEQNLLLTEQHRVLMKASGLGSALPGGRRGDIVSTGVAEATQTDESLLYVSLGMKAASLRYQMMGAASRDGPSAHSQHATTPAQHHHAAPPEGVDANSGGGGGGIAVEAASMFSPYVKDIWGSSSGGPNHRDDTLSRQPQSHPPARAPSTGDGERPLRGADKHVHFPITSPLQDAHARGYMSLEEWDRVLEAKAEAFLHKEVEWSVKERQLLVLERELDVRIKQTSRESSSLRYELQETKRRFDAVTCVSRKLLLSRKMRQRHLIAMETSAMTTEDPLRSSASSSLLQPTTALKIAAAVSSTTVVSVSVGVQVDDQTPAAITHETKATKDDDQQSASWWASTKGAVFGKAR